MHVEQVADGIHRLTDGITNCYVCADGDEVLLIDGAWPRSVREVIAALRGLGHAPGDVTAVLITHGHPDHFGAAQPLRDHHGTAIRAHPADGDLLRGKRLSGSPVGVMGGVLKSLWRPFTWRFAAHGLRHGFLTPNWVDDFEPVTDSERLDLPHHPTVVHTPGHTAGHAVYHLADHGVVFSGDAIITTDIASGRKGAFVGAFSEDTEEAYRSLDRVGALDAELLLPGHGAPWRGSAANAAEVARSGR